MLMSKKQKMVYINGFEDDWYINTLKALINRKWVLKEQKNRDWEYYLDIEDQWGDELCKEFYEDVVNAERGKPRKDPPYIDINVRKLNSLGKTMTLKQALNLWWNSVRVRTKNNIVLCYKRFNGEYELQDSDEIALDTKVVLDNEFDYDADGYPIVYATLL